MPAFGPIKRKNLIKNLRTIGFAGPYAGGKHQFMIRGEIRVRLPNPHEGDIGKNLLSRLLQQTGVHRDEWESL